MQRLHSFATSENERFACSCALVVMEPCTSVARFRTRTGTYRCEYSWLLISPSCSQFACRCAHGFHEGSKAAGNVTSPRPSLTYPWIDTVLPIHIPLRSLSLVESCLMFAVVLSYYLFALPSQHRGTTEQPVRSSLMC